LAYYGDYTYNEIENVNMEALESGVDDQIVGKTREKEGGVYGVGVGRVSVSCQKHVMLFPLVLVRQ
jgi:hypothetical protein